MDALDRYEEVAEALATFPDVELFFVSNGKAQFVVSSDVPKETLIAIDQTLRKHGLHAPGIDIPNVFMGGTSTYLVKELKEAI